MRNIEKYEKEVLDSLNYCDLDRKLENVDKGLEADCTDRNCRECKNRYREWLLEEAKEPVLDEVEKAYLSAVIRPFRNRVNYITKEDYITKEETFDSPMEFIHIDLSDGDIADFPNFKANTMYKGMELDKSYTLQELGL